MVRLIGILRHLRKQPLTAIDLVFMGDCIIKSGNFSEAISVLKRSLDDPNGSDITVADAYFDLGVAYRAQGEYDLAAEHFEKSIEVNDNYLEDVKEAMEGFAELRRLHLKIVK